MEKKKPQVENDESVESARAQSDTVSRSGHNALQHSRESQRECLRRSPGAPPRPLYILSHDKLCDLTEILIFSVFQETPVFLTFSIKYFVVA